MAQLDFFFFFFALWGIRNEKFILFIFLSTTQIDASGGRMREILKTTTTKQITESDIAHRPWDLHHPPHKPPCRSFSLVTVYQRH